MGSEEDRASVYGFLTSNETNLYLLAAFNVDESKWENANQDGNDQVYHLKRDKWYRMRIMTANPDAEPETVKVDDGCEAHAIAHDGVLRFHPPKERLNYYFLTGASRVDLAIRCNNTGTFSITISEGWEGYSTEGAEPVWDGVGWEGAQRVASLEVTDDGDVSNHPSPFLPNGMQWKSYRQPYLQDISGLERPPERDRWITIVDNNDMNDLKYNECESLITVE